MVEQLFVLLHLFRMLITVADSTVLLILIVVAAVADARLTALELMPHAKEHGLMQLMAVDNVLVPKYVVAL